MKLFVATAVAILAATPAYAGKYACTFRSGAGAIKQCDIETGGAGRVCSHPHSPTLLGACFVDPAGPSDRMQCVYFRGDNLAELTKAVNGAAAAGLAPLTEQKGFIAGGVTLGPPATLTLVAGYRESDATPLLQVLCTPKR